MGFFALDARPRCFFLVCGKKEEGREKEGEVVGGRVLLDGYGSIWIFLLRGFVYLMYRMRKVFGDRDCPVSC